VNPDPKAKEVYEVGGGQLGLSKVVLDKLAGAAGVSWSPLLCHRTDDGRDPHYCSWVAVGTVRHFDGSSITIQAHKEMDLREGSAQVEALWERYNAELAKFKAGKSGKQWPPKEPTAQIREMRLHIQAHAESKAKNRAIRSIGIKSSYTAQELAKPFAVARLMATGRSTDPELQREFQRMQFAHAIGADQALYGAPAQELRQAPIGPAMHQLPPLEHEEPRQLPPSPPTIQRDSDPGPRAEPSSDPGAPEPPREPAQEAPKPAPRNGPKWPWEAKQEGDPPKGTPLVDLESSHVRRLGTYYRKPGKPQYAAANAATVKACDEILAARGEPTTEPTEGGEY